MRLVVAVGENLHRAVRRETTMLEHLLADNMLNEFYVSAMGVKEVTQFLATTVSQVVHRHPRMKVLEIGTNVLMCFYTTANTTQVPAQVEPRKQSLTKLVVHFPRIPSQTYLQDFLKQHKIYFLLLERR